MPGENLILVPPSKRNNSLNQSQENGAEMYPVGRLSASQPRAPASGMGWTKYFGLTSTSAIALTASANLALADSGISTTLLAGISALFDKPFASPEITMLAVFGGAMSFALMSASWLIRERGRISDENQSLKDRLVDLKASQERMDALLNSADHMVVVWNGIEEKPAILGNLRDVEGVPLKQENFLAFGTWIETKSAINFEAALKELRQKATSFEIPITTKTGAILEAQGRTSGGHAFVRFLELGGDRASLAELQTRHAQLIIVFNSIQKLLDSLEIPLWMRDEETKLYWVNQAYAAAVDASNGNDAIKNNLQLFDSAERNEIAVAHTKSGEFKGRLPAVVSGDRKVLDVMDIVSEHGSAGLAIDKSEVELANAKLSKTISSNSKMLDQLATAVAIFDASKTLQFYNSSFQNLWDLDSSFLESNPSHSEILATMRSANKLPEQSDWSKWRETQTAVYQALEPAEENWHLPDGTTLRVISSPQEQGGAFWTFENMTEKLTLESKYNALMKVQGETLDHLYEAVAVFGSDGKLKLSNPAFRQLLNDASETKELPKLENTHVSSLLANLQSVLVDKTTTETIASSITDFNDERGNREGRLELLDNRILDYVLVPLPQGQTLLTFFDRTDSVNVERALQERAEAFEASDHLKTRFIKHVSYELRAPLTNISGFGELLRDGNLGTLNEKQQEYVDHINTSCDSLKTIVDDILDLATVDAGAMDLNLQRVNVEETIQTSLEGLKSELQRNTANVEIEIEAGSETIVADPSRLLQIVYNLLSNALNFSPPAGQIQIAAKTVGNEVEIAVSDNGPGVPEEQRTTIFNRFESQGPKNSRQGTGLGLSIVHSFTHLHGGTVHVEEAQSGGARFVCRFPKDPIHMLDAAE